MGSGIDLRKIIMRIRGGWDKVRREDSGLLGCDAVSLGKYFAIF
jgi:hypothetical protein